MIEKHCPGCNKDLPLSAFGSRIKRGKLEIRSQCKECGARGAARYRAEHPEKVRAAKQAYRSKPQALSQGRRDQRRQAIRNLGYEGDPDALIAWMEEHGSCCDLCHYDISKSPRYHNLHIDHDHSSGKIRGLLCHNCNMALGLLRDDASLLRRAADYLDNPPGIGPDCAGRLGL